MGLYGMGRAAEREIRSQTLSTQGLIAFSISDRALRGNSVATTDYFCPGWRLTIGDYKCPLEGTLIISNR